MTDLHPHWRSTQDDPIVIPGPSDSHGQNLGQSVSRRPAAVIGILLVCIAGSLMIGNVGDIIGQLGGDTPGAGSSSSSVLSATGVTIHLTADGVDPAQATILPGQEITWVNDSAIPHILESDDILGEDGASLYTAAIFPGTSVTFRLSPDQPVGTYRYASTTSDNVTGDLVVTTDAGAQASVGTDPLGGKTVEQQVDPFATPDGASSSDAFSLPNDPFGELTSSSSSESPDITAPSQDQIPTNPDTFQSLTDPLFGQTQSTHQAAPYSPEPNMQPESGMETWISFPFAVLVFVFLERRLLRRTHA